MQTYRLNVEKHRSDDRFPNSGERRKNKRKKKKERKEKGKGIRKMRLDALSKISQPASLKIAYLSRIRKQKRSNWNISRRDKILPRGFGKMAAFEELFVSRQCLEQCKLVPGSVFTRRHVVYRHDLDTMLDIPCDDLSWKFHRKVRKTDVEGGREGSTRVDPRVPSSLPLKGPFSRHTHTHTYTLSFTFKCNLPPLEAAFPPRLMELDDYLVSLPSSRINVLSCQMVGW